MDFKYKEATKLEAKRLYRELYMNLSDQAVDKKIKEVVSAILCAINSEDDFLFKLNVYAASYTIWRTTKDKEKRDLFFQTQQIYENEIILAISRQLNDATKEEYLFHDSFVYQSMTVLCVSYFVDGLYKGYND